MIRQVKRITSRTVSYYRAVLLGELSAIARGLHSDGGYSCSQYSHLAIPNLNHMIVSKQVSK